MWGFPLMFWLVALLIYAIAVRRRRRWARWALMHPGAYAPYAYLPYANPRYDIDRRTARAGRGRDEGEQSYVETLESRIAELEERLDFTERLLAGRQSTARRD